MQGFVGQQTYLEQCSKLYWQPTKGTKQWNTASKWRGLSHQAGQSILDTLKFGEVSVRDAIQKGVLSGLSFSLFVDTHDWTEAKHDCKSFSAAAESPDAKETYSWLSSA